MRDATEEEAHLDGARTESVVSYKNLLASRDGRVASARKTKGPGSDRWKRMEIKLRNSEEKSRAIFAKLQRLTDGRRISFWWFVAGAIILAALEAPINKFMLDNILRGNNFDSYLLSLFMTLALLLLAHIAGHQARQIRGTYHETIYISNIVITLLILIVLTACIGALTIGRAFYSIAPTGAAGRDIFSELTHQILTIGPWTAFVEALSDKAAFFLACLNTAGISVAFLTAFITHDSDKVYQSILDAEDSADRSLARMNRKYDRMVAKAAKLYAPKLTNIAAAHGSQTAQIVALKRARGAPLSEEDSFDLSSLDVLLNEARNEIGRRSRHIENAKSDNPVKTKEKEDVSPAVAQLVREHR